MIGQVFGRWTVIAPAEPYAWGRLRFTCWVCQCMCGKTKVVRQSRLRDGKSGSCGCLRSDLIALRHFKHGEAQHGPKGFGRTDAFTCWCSMRQRVLDTNYKGYANYGGRGITICDRWGTFANFLEDMGRRPSPKHSLDRINNEGNYEPSNCRWATPKEQANNKRPRRKGYKHKKGFTRRRRSNLPPLEVAA